MQQWLRISSLLVMAGMVGLLVTACGGGSTGAVTPAGVPSAIQGKSFYVNPATGSDTTGDGSVNAPYKTLTKAIQMASAIAATSGANIYAASGLYSTVSGETFPIKPTKGDNIIGTGIAQISGTGVATFGGGNLSGYALSYAVFFSSGVAANMTSMSIGGSQETIGVDNATVTLSNNSLSGSTDVAMVVSDGAHLTLSGNTVNNGVWGLLLADPTTVVVARGNSILTQNMDAIHIGYTSAVPGTALDLGTATNPGNNTILGSATGMGLNLANVSATSGVVQAVGNTWHPNIQGANFAGHYASAVIAAGTAYLAGNNYANPATAIQF